MQKIKNMLRFKRYKTKGVTLPIDDDER